MTPDISLYAETNRGLRLINESGYPEIVVEDRPNLTELESGSRHKIK